MTNPKSDDEYLNFVEMSFFNEMIQVGNSRESFRREGTFYHLVNLLSRDFATSPVP